jgi:hypothetical protein
MLLLKNPLPQMTGFEKEKEPFDMVEKKQETSYDQTDYD